MPVHGRADRSGFIAPLESLRGLAALMVAADHAAASRWRGDQPLLGTAPDWNHPVSGSLFRLYHAVFSGHSAVVFFFVLSGFVLSLSLRRETDPAGVSAGRFVLRRAFRLYPAIVSAILGFAAVYWIFGASLPGVTGASYTPSGLLRHMLLLDVQINGVMWTLQVEVIAIPLILGAVMLERRWGAGALVALAVLLFILSRDRRWNLPIHDGVSRLGPLYCFVFGMLVHSVGRAVVGRLGVSGSRGLLLLAMLGFFGARSVLGFASYLSPVVESSAAASILAVLAYGRAGTWTRPLDWPVVRLYGRISYSFYLLHPLTLIVLWAIPDTIAALLRAGLPSVVVALGLAMISIAAITPLAWLSWRWIEAPGVRLGRWLTRPESRPARSGVSEVATRGPAATSLARPTGTRLDRPLRS